MTLTGNVTFKTENNKKFFNWIIIVLVLYCCIPATFSQGSRFRYDNCRYLMTPTEDSLYNTGEYRKSIEYNLAQLDSTGQLGRVNGYLLAQSYALLEMEDSAFYYLNYYIDTVNPSDYRSVYVERDFELLRKNETEWNKILNRIEQLYLEELDSTMNKDVAVKLFRMWIEDQKYRGFWAVSCRRGEGVISAQESVSIHIKQKKDLKKIIKKYGFPTPSKVGHTASNAAFFVLQHSTIENKYYHMVRKAFEKGDFSREAYALLTDRWLRQQGKLQIYGTQFVRDKTKDIWVLTPVKDFKNVNQRRSELGLSSIEEYAKRKNGTIPEEYYNETNINTNKK